jgi:hypothetical protein
MRQAEWLSTGGSPSSNAQSPLVDTNGSAAPNLVSGHTVSRRTLLTSLLGGTAVVGAMPGIASCGEPSQSSPYFTDIATVTGTPPQGTQLLLHENADAIGPVQRMT